MVKEITDGGVQDPSVTGFRHRIDCWHGGDVMNNFTNDILMERKSMVGPAESNSVPQTHIPRLVQYYKEGKYPVEKLVKFYNSEGINHALEESEIGVTIKPIV